MLTEFETIFNMVKKKCSYADLFTLFLSTCALDFFFFKVSVPLRSQLMAM